MSKKQIPCFWEAYILKMDCIIWLKLCLANVFAPAGMVHYVICKRIRDCWCGLNKKTKAIPQLSVFYKHSVALEGPPCWLCVESEHLALGSVWVFFVHTLHAPYTFRFVMEWPTYWWAEAFWGQLSVCLIITLRVAHLCFRTWCLTDTLSKLTMLLFALPGSIQLVWRRNGYVTCLVHVKAHRPIFPWNSSHIYHQIGQDQSSFWLSLVNSSIFLGW